MLSVGDRINTAAAADAFPDGQIFAAACLIRPFGISKLSASDGHEVADAFLQKLFCNSGLLYCIDRNDRDADSLLDLLCKLLPRSLFRNLGWFNSLQMYLKSCF